MYDLLALTDADWRQHLDYAAGLARRLDAGLTGLRVFPSPYVADGLYGYGVGDTAALVLDSVRRAESSAQADGTAFTAWAAAAGVRAPAWQVAEGSLPAVLRRLGNRHDLLLLARDAQSEEQRARLGAIVLECGMPVILVPAQAAARLDCIAVAWNGSAEALRALQAARPLLACAQRVVVLRGELHDRYAEIGWLPPFDLDVYLHRHGIQAEYRGITGPEGEAGRSLLAAARDAGADLLVMGAYGRTRFSEWVFGGATRHIVAEAGLPVLLRH